MITAQSPVVTSDPLGFPGSEKALTYVDGRTRRHMLGENKQLKEKLAETKALLTQASSFPPLGSLLRGLIPRRPPSNRNA